MPDLTVRPDGPQGQPDNVTPCWACNGAGLKVAGDGAETFECTVCDGTGLSAAARIDLDELRRGLREATGADRNEFTDAVPGLTHPYWCDRMHADTASHTSNLPDFAAEPTALVEAERRTVSLEVLTDELRTAACNIDAEDPRGKVGVVMRVNGQVVDIPELDSLWTAPFRQPADVLAKMLEQGRNYASGIDGQSGAELLMPTPDVLAALDGRPDAQLLTAPVHVLAMDVKAGMFLHSTDDDGDGAETLELVTAERDCDDPECIHGASCVVLTVSGHEDPDVHFGGFGRIAVRIPASVTR